MPTALDLYRVTGRAGNVGTPGAPILDFDLLVNSSAGSICGQAHINQAVAPPDGEIHIHNVTGTVRELVFGGQITLVVALQDKPLLLAGGIVYTDLQQEAVQLRPWQRISTF